MDAKTGVRRLQTGEQGVPSRGSKGTGRRCQRERARTASGLRSWGRVCSALSCRVRGGVSVTDALEGQARRCWSSCVLLTSRLSEKGLSARGGVFCSPLALRQSSCPVQAAGLVSRISVGFLVAPREAHRSPEPAGHSQHPTLMSLVWFLRAPPGRRFITAESVSRD